jgi:lipopolysaccharide biosynthesis glycosyltransferase
MRKLPIFFSFDDGYVVPAAVTFESLLTNARTGVFYELFVLHAGLSPANQERLAALVARHGNATLVFLDVGATLQAAGIVFDDRSFCLGEGKAQFTKETLLRCLPTLVPQFDGYDRILYSDVDVCVVDDISEIFEINLGTNYIGGCRMPKRYSGQILHLPGKIQSSYFAGGIWLMNLRQMRADGLTKDIVEIMRNPPVRLLWNDQDVMNLACRDKVTYISYRYCSIPHWKAEFKKTGLHDEHFPSGELSEALFRAKIVHYAATKPWNGPCEQDDLWHYWHSRTGFAPVASKFDKAENVSVYLFKYLKLPTGLVKARFRGGVLEVKAAGFFLRIRLSRFEEQ